MKDGDQPWFLYHGTRGCHFDNYPPDNFKGKSRAKYPFHDVLVECDDIFGRLFRALEETGQLENTLIFLTSDNGPEMESWPDSSYTPFRGSKGTTWEGGVRVPGIFYWKGMIEAGASPTGCSTSATSSPRSAPWRGSRTCPRTASSTAWTSAASCWRTRAGGHALGRRPGLVVQPRWPSTAGCWTALGDARGAATRRTA